ncbi:glutamate receptor ionotropic, delta-2-like isoform X2 [Anneissia japonica]|uniref:glutamate receptor ionotropic, delta-2-like isoform X2 n=1 Tax=Anneissia japonica TaxID=1529436 RepID=UPI00142558A2|nr:glutamate receptor ionotropic, delta-2-like isoform X2 [Anneissia japonica]
MDFFMICILFLPLHPYIGICGALTNAPTKIHIGVLLEDPTQREEDIVALAVQQINESENLLKNIEFSYDLKNLSFGNPYQVIREACSLLDDNITALVSSTSCESNLAIQSLAEEYNIPHFAVPKDKCSIEKSNSFTVSIRPSFEHQNAIVFDFIKYMKWIKVCIFYDSDIAFRNVEDMLTEASSDNYYLEVILFRLERNRSGELDTVSSLDLAKKSSIKHFIVFCNTRNSLKLLQMAANHGMASEDYKWIVTTQMSRDEESPAGREREETEAAEGLQFFNTTDRGILELLRNQILINKEPDFLEAWLHLHPHVNYTFESDAAVITPNPFEDIQITAAYLYDAIRFVATAVKLQIEKSWENPLENRCLRKKKKNNEKWETGSKLMNTVRSMSPFKGLTGPIYLPNADVNINISMEILTIQRTSNVSSSLKIGTWDIVGGLNLTATPFVFQNSFPKNKTLRIVTIVEAPFVVKEDSVEGTEYTGFCIELIQKIAKDLEFEYTIYDVPDKQYGVREKDGKWNGLIGQVYYSKADIALAGMIINSDREEVIDFTKPYMNYGVGILMKKTEEQRNVFAFLDPLACTVWFSILAALFVVGIMVYVLDRLSPYSSYRSSNRSPDVDDFNFRNSMWFAFASCMQQAPWKYERVHTKSGGDNTPISISGRILSAAWWMFALIIIATYTANLAAFLTVTRMENPINSLEDLAYQKKVSYGTINGSSLEKYFEKRKHTGIYEILWNYMSDVDSLLSPMVDSAEEGYNRVADGNYAFFWDAPILDYIKQTECDLMTVGKPFNLKGYGIATAEGSPYRDKMSMAILKLQEDGELEDMRKRWFERESSCSDDQASIARNANANEIGLNKIAGAFYILIMGIVLSFIVVGVEHMTFNKYKNGNRKFDNKYESDWREVRTSRNNGVLENSSHIVVRNDDSVVLSPLRPKAWNTSINSESAC